MAGGEAGAALSSLLSLAAVLVMLALAVFVARRLQRAGRLPGAPRAGGDGFGIRLLSIRPLGWQSSLQLLEVDGRRVLLGVSRSGITALGIWPGTTTIGETEGVPAAAPPRPGVTS